VVTGDRKVLKLAMTAILSAVTVVPQTVARSNLGICVPRRVTLVTNAVTVHKRARSIRYASNVTTATKPVVMVATPTVG
jgi:hypothetical protein